jgi:hypothetical protein
VITLPRLGAIGAALLVGTAVALTTASPAHAQATRTWVSGVGDDANPCSRTAPCKTFAGAISKTAAGGEIDALDPGGFGALTITKSITIDGGGFIAGVLTAGTNGIVIQAGTDDNVVLRNLDLQDGTTTPSNCALSGVRVVSARSVQMEHVSIVDYDNGISLPLTGSSPDVYVDTTLDDVSIKNTRCAGIDAAPDTGHLARVALSRSILTQDNTAYVAGPGSESWLSGSSVVLNNTGLSNTGGILHDACGNTVSGNATDGTFDDHATGCAPPSTSTSSPGQSGSTASAGGAAPAPSYCGVPKLKGRTRATAAKALRAAHCTLGKVKKQKGTKAKRGKVRRQGIPAGTSVKPGTAVTIVLGR